MMSFVFQSYRTVDLVATKGFFRDGTDKKRMNKQPTQSVKRVFRMNENWKLIEYTSKLLPKYVFPSKRITMRVEGWNALLEGSSHLVSD